jgi:hypothetical protein
VTRNVIGFTVVAGRTRNVSPGFSLSRVAESLLMAASFAAAGQAPVSRACSQNASRYAIGRPVDAPTAPG